MIKHIVAAAVMFLIAACAPSNGTVTKQTATEVRTAPAKAQSTKANGEVPAEIRIASSVGAVVFHHQMHFQDLSIACVECHHQIDAKELKTPHADYLAASSVKCTTCHKDPSAVSQPIYTCSECHSSSPKNIADETLSAKVVVHNKCWKCHEVGKGKDASTGCVKCHSGSKTAAVERTQ